MLSVKLNQFRLTLYNFIIFYGRLCSMYMSWFYANVGRCCLRDNELAVSIGCGGLYWFELALDSRSS